MLHSIEYWGKHRVWFFEMAQAFEFMQKKQYSRALYIYEKIKFTYEKDSETTPNLLHIFYENMIVCYQALNRFKEAKKLKIIADKLRDQLPQTWRSLNDKGVEAYDAGKYKEAANLFEKALPLVIKQFGKGHINYLTTLGNLALQYRLLGKFDKAKSLLMEKIKAAKKEFGRKSPEYATGLKDLALWYFEQDLDLRAKPLLIRALKFFNTQATNERYIQGYLEASSTLANIYFRSGKYQDAKAIMERKKKVIEIKFGKNNHNYVLVCNNLATVYSKVKLYQKSTVLLKEALKITKRTLGIHSPDYALMCRSLALAYRNQDLIQKSEQLFIESLKIQENISGTKNLQYIDTCFELAKLYLRLDKHKKAEKLLQQAKQTILKNFTANHHKQVSILIKLADLFLEKDDYIQAENFYKNAQNIALKHLGKTSNTFADATHAIANLYRTKGRYKEAEKLYEKSHKIKAKATGVAPNNYLHYCDHQVSLYMKMGKMRKAELICLRLKKITNKNNSSHASINTRLASIYVDQGLINKAEKLLREAKIICKNTLGKTHGLYGVICSDLASIYRSKGMYNKAESLYIESMGVQATLFGENNVEYAKTIHNLANLYLGQGLQKKATKLYKESVGIISKKLGEDHPDYAGIVINLARAYTNQSQYKKALPYLLKAKKIAEDTYPRTHPEFTLACFKLACLYQILGEHEKALALFREVSENVPQQLTNALRYKSEFERKQFLISNNDELVIQNSFTKALVDSLDMDASKEMIEQTYNNHIFTKSLIFNSSQGIKERILNSKDTSVINLYYKLITKRIDYSRALEKSARKLKNQGINLDSLKEEVNWLEKSLAIKSTSFARQLEEYKIHKWEEVKKNLRRGEVAIEIIRFHWHFTHHTDSIYYVALIVTPKSRFPYPVYFTNGNFLESKGFRDYQFFTKNQKNAPKAYARFWQPIQAQLKKLYPKVQWVFISLDGVYHQLNLKTLWNPATKQYLGDELDIHLVSNTKDLLKRNEKNKAMASHRKAEVQLFGYPDYSRFARTARKPSQYDGFFGERNQRDLRDFFKNGIIRRLPGTQKEVQQIGGILAAHRIPHRVYLDTNATETKLKAVRSPKVLHLATHGYFINHNDLEDLRKQRQWAGTEFKQYVANPLLRAGLVWTGAQATLRGETRPQNVPDNGILTAQEVLNLNLDSTQLVVLSACETGLGKVENGRRVYGLQRAFLSAGAQYVLMSLWKVDDEVTNYFMQYFYEAWAKHQDVRQAHHYAQQKLRTSKRGKYHSPYYWGAFVLVGK
jgi:CHAT domain-containing protein